MIGTDANAQKSRVRHLMRRIPYSFKLASVYDEELVKIYVLCDLWQPPKRQVAGEFHRKVIGEQLALAGLPAAFLHSAALLRVEKYTHPLSPYTPKVSLSKTSG
jgi:hypothetical protein